VTWFDEAAELGRERDIVEKRSVAGVILLTFFTFGIYGLFWLVQTKDELVREGADIPTAWLLLIPFANLYWSWKWSGGVEHVTGGKLSQAVAFLLMCLLGLIGMAIIQAELNEAVERRRRPQLPRARVV
jgi:hypothetical protein